MHTAPNIRILQFMNAGVGFGSSGKKDQTKVKTRKTSEAMLSGRPNLPRSKRRGSSCSLRHRFNAMQEIEHIYDARIATSESEAMLLKATVEPMLMRASRQDTMQETRTALTGISHPGGTWEVQVS
jgi:hypothetical protein